MSTSRNKSVKTKSNSHKKLRKPTIHDPEVQHNQKLENKESPSEHSTRKTHNESSICKSLENIMHLKTGTGSSGNHDPISLSKTDISIVYGMYKNLMQTLNINNEMHVDNYQSLLDEFHKLQSQLYEQGMCNKSSMSTLSSQLRMDRRMRRKGMEKGNKIMIMKMNEIISIVYKLQSSLESVDQKTVTLDSKIDESLAVHQENNRNRKKKFVFCSCM